MPLRISYYAKFSKSTSLGVARKISMAISSLNDAGYQASMKPFPANSLKSNIAFFYSLSKESSDIVIIRSTGALILCIPVLTYLRFRGIKIVIDVPTPKSTAIREILGEEGRLTFKKLLSVITTFLLYPASWLPAHRILQHASDSRWFLLGINNRTKIIGNRVFCKSIPFTPIKKTLDPATPLKLACIAKLEYWHGYDRLINALRLYYDEGFIKELQIHIIGEGPDRQRLMSLVQEQRLQKYIHFWGNREGDMLTEVMNEMDIGICSLGLFRKKLHEASELKAREYLARGLPIVLSVKDPDISFDNSFVYRVANDESLIDLKDLLCWYENSFTDPQRCIEIRAFAENKLDYGRRFNTDILDLL